MSKLDLRICDDYLQFQNHLKDLRRMDDLIMNTLNTTVLTTTFRSRGADTSKQCQQLGDEVRHSLPSLIRLVTRLFRSHRVPRIVMN